MKKRLKNFLSLLIYSGLFLPAIILPTVALAHELQYDNSIGAVLHVDPEDNPVTNQVSTFYFDLKDTSSRFNPEQCNCKYDLFLISGRGQPSQLIKEAKFSAQKSSASEWYITFAETFTEKGIYRLVLQGLPKSDPDLFSSFILSYDIGAFREGSTSLVGQAATVPYVHSAHIIIFGVGFIVVFLVLSQEKYNTKSKSKTEKQ